MTTVNIHEAKTKLSSLLSIVERKHEHVTICRAGHPIAELVPYQKQNRSKVNEKFKPIKIKGDLTLPTSADWNV